MEQKMDGCVNINGVVFKLNTEICECCKESFSRPEMPLICITCMEKVLSKPIKIEVSKWVGYKRFAYWLLLYMPLTVLIGIVWGIEVQWVSLGMFIFGMYISDIINWLMRVF